MLYRNKTWLKRKYYEEGLSTKAIGLICGVGKSTINTWLRKHGIEVKFHGGKITKGKLLHNKDYLYVQYVILKKSTSEIGAKHNTLRSNVRLCLIKFNIERRKKSEYMRLIKESRIRKKIPDIEPVWLWLLMNGFAHRVPQKIREKVME